MSLLLLLGKTILNTNRNFIGIELDKKYCEIAKQRIKSAQKHCSNVS